VSFRCAKNNCISPKINYSIFINEISTQKMFSLNLLPTPKTKTTFRNWLNPLCDIYQYTAYLFYTLHICYIYSWSESIAQINSESSPTSPIQHTWLCNISTWKQFLWIDGRKDHTAFRLACAARRSPFWKPEEYFPSRHQKTYPPGEFDGDRVPSTSAYIMQSFYCP